MTAGGSERVGGWGSMTGVARGVATVLYGALLCLLVSWPLPFLPANELPGSPFGEVDNHYWIAWVEVQRLGGDPGPWSNWPVGWELPFMDPVNLLFLLPAWGWGPVLAYRAVLLGNLGLAAAGGYAFARVLTASHAAALVGLAAAVGAPFLAGVVDFGITEAWPVGWMGLHAAAVLLYAREGGWGRGVLASGTLAAFLASGWYHDVFAVPVEIGLLLWAGARIRNAGTPMAVGVRRLGGLLVLVALAGLTRVPAWMAMVAHPDLWEARFSGLSAPIALPDWRANPTFGVDLLCFFLPQPTALPVSRTVYLGIATVGLALLGAWRGPGRVPVVLATMLLTLAVGHWLRLGGQTPGRVPLRMPAGVLVQLLPAFRGLSHWFRAVGPATPLLAAAAAAGVAPWLARRRHPALVAGVLGLGVVGEGIVAAPTAWPRHHYAVDPPEVLARLTSPGAVLDLPVDDAGAPPPGRSRRPYNQWQPVHQRPIAENYEGPDAVFGYGRLVPIWNTLCGAPAPRGTPHEIPLDPAPDVAALRAAGFGVVIVHPPLARDPEGCVRGVEEVLGVPVARSPEAVVWEIGDR